MTSRIVEGGLLGATLGHYSITGKIGAGGMGEVYRAKDTKLGRDVAIKVLPAEFAQDAERLARFEREARLLASLNHPGIAHVYGFEAATLADGTTVHFLAMEMVEGEDLAQRLTRGAVPVDEAIGIAQQIAEGLEEAHEHGVIHRDLKPANIKLTPDGKVKILDFGLAKAYLADAVAGGTSDISHSPTMTKGTEAGMILGTAAYMSPEQARGKAVDKRADIWAFGVVVFEILSGERLFVGDSVSDVLVAVLTREPNWSALPASLAPSHQLLLRRCLQRDPKKRLRDVGDARLVLGATEPADRYAETRSAETRPRSRPLRWIAALAANVAIIAAIVVLSRRDAPSVSLDTARLTPFVTDTAVQTMPAWSPDGKTLAYSQEVGGYYQIFTRQPGQSTASQLTSLEMDCLFPKWDPTGTRIFFQPSLGETAGAADWAVGEVFVVSAAGGAPEKVSEETTAFAVTPEGDAIVYLKFGPREGGGWLELWSHDLKTAAARKIRTLSNRPESTSSLGLHFSPDGKRLAMLGAFRGDELLLLSNPLKADEAPHVVSFATTEGGSVSLEDFSFLPDGLQFVAGGRDPRGGDKSFWLGDIEGGTVTRLTASAWSEGAPAVAPDGSRVAFGSAALDWDILEIEPKTGVSNALVSSSRYDGWGEWLPDESGLVYSTNRTGRYEIWSENLRDHSTRAIVTPDAFPDGSTLYLVSPSVSPDARSVAYQRITAAGIRIHVSAIAGSKPVLLTPGARTREYGPVWSADGRWILFRTENRLMKALAGGGAEGTTLAEDVADLEASRARWLPDGSVLYQAVDGLRQVSRDGGPSRLVSGEKPLVWDLVPDGRVVHAIIEGERRAIDLASIDLATGKASARRPLGRRPLWPTLGYAESLRAMRVSPDGTRLMYAVLKPEADIWILEDFTPKSRPPWWAFWRR